MVGKNIYRLFVTFLASILFTGCGSTTVSQIEEKYDSQQLPPKQVLKLVEGNTMLFVSFNEDSYFYFDTSGRVYGIDLYKNKDIGRWDVADTGELCLKMQSWWYGDLRCFTVYPAADKYALANSAGVIAFNAEQFQGDLKNQYYEPKKEKSSYRRSIRQKQTDNNTAPEKKPDTESEDKKPARISIAETEKNQPSDTELHSTVRWMARDCPGCNLENTNLKKADLVGAQLQGANLSGANLSMADMRRADLRDANLENADLSFANMPGANLRNCNLTNANLKGANLIRADLTGADLDGADLENALLEGAIGIK